MNRDELEVRVSELETVGLSPRKAEVWARRERGRTYQEIGEELGIDPSTVATLASRVRDDLREARELLETTSLEAVESGK